MMYYYQNDPIGKYYYESTDDPCLFNCVFNYTNHFSTFQTCKLPEGYIILENANPIYHKVKKMINLYYIACHNIITKNSTGHCYTNSIPVKKFYDFYTMIDECHTIDINPRKITLSQHSRNMYATHYIPGEIYYPEILQRTFNIIEELNKLCTKI